MNHNEPYPENYLAEILSSVKNIAMVGASPDPTKFSYGVLRVLHEQGFNMMPINPRPDLEEIRGIKVYSSIEEIEGSIDMVQVFRNSNALNGIALDAIKVGAKVLWAQIGVKNNEAAPLTNRATRV